MEKPKIPEEIAAIEKSRTISDAKFLKGGARYQVSENPNGAVLELTERQIEEIERARERCGSLEYFEGLKQVSYEEVYEAVKTAVKKSIKEYTKDGNGKVSMSEEFTERMYLCQKFMPETAEARQAFNAYVSGHAGIFGIGAFNTRDPGRFLLPGNPGSPRNLTSAREMISDMIDTTIRSEREGVERGLAIATLSMDFPKAIEEAEKLRAQSVQPIYGAYEVSLI